MSTKEEEEVANVADGDQVPLGIEDISQTELPEGTVTAADDDEEGS